MKNSQERDALLALISTLTVVFVVLFFSISYFLMERQASEQRAAAAMAELQNMQNTAGSVAGYSTDGE